MTGLGDAEDGRNKSSVPETGDSVFRDKAAKWILFISISVSLLGALIAFILAVVKG